MCSGVHRRGEALHEPVADERGGDAGHREDPDGQGEGPAGATLTGRLGATLTGRLGATLTGRLGATLLPGDGGRDRQREQHEQEHGGDDREFPLVAGGRGVEGVGQRRDEPCGDREHEQQRQGARAGGPERLGAVPQAPHEEGEPEHEQHVREHGADQGRPHHVVEPVPQGEQADEELGQVPQRRLQDARCAGPEPVAEPVDGAPDDGRQQREGDRRHEERHHRRQLDDARQAREDRRGGGAGEEAYITAAQPARLAGPPAGAGGRLAKGAHGPAG